MVYFEVMTLGVAQCGTPIIVDATKIKPLKRLGIAYSFTTQGRALEK